ncbi:MAG TPA: outer membrane lipoprotein LolB [Chromatiales bacterium]|nr:outer membrane lipoprotein LolB [Chromatiales bacterium]
MRLAAVFAVLLGLAGCAGPAVKPADRHQAWEARQQSLARLSQWRMSGRVSIVRGSESWHLNVRWRQAGDRFDIFLSGPFGAGQARLAGTAEQVMLYDSEQRSYTASSPERLLYDHTGIYMPVSGLRYWVLGLPDPGKNHDREVVLDDYGRLTELRQRDWQVSLGEYVEVDQVQLPERLEIRRNDVTVRLVVDDWRLMPG